MNTFPISDSNRKKINAEKKHSIPIGSLVELPNGARLFVVDYRRDCDQSPLYCLSWDVDRDYFVKWDNDLKVIK